MKKQWIVATLVAVALTAGGCGSDDDSLSDDNLNSLDYDRLYETPGRWIPDVPQPQGFDLVESRSLHFSAGDTRYISHLYKGSKNKRSVTRFFRQMMPRYRWQLVSDDLTQGEVTLDYRKGPEKCTIVVRGGGSWSNPTYIKVTIMWTGTHVSVPMEPAPLPAETYPSD